MKIKVNRLLSGGKYQVGFEVSDFSPEEVEQMSKFGVPYIPLRWTYKMGQAAGRVALNEIRGQAARFDLEEQAKQYEEEVINNLRAAVVTLRERKDEFTSSAEVDL
jgi:hypothetical protein